MTAQQREQHHRHLQLRFVTLGRQLRQLQRASREQLRVLLTQPGGGGGGTTGGNTPGVDGRGEGEVLLAAHPDVQQQQQQQERDVIVAPDSLGTEPGAAASVTVETAPARNETPLAEMAQQVATAQV